jgi:Gpi18-like mannosyltransferase
MSVALWYLLHTHTHLFLSQQCAVSQKEIEIPTKGQWRKDQTFDALEENNTIVYNVIKT